MFHLIYARQYSGKLIGCGFGPFLQPENKKEISSDDKQSVESHCFEYPSQERMEKK